MIEGIIDWFQQIQAQGIVIRPRTRRQTVPQTPQIGPQRYYLNDPSTPELIGEEIPPSQTKLAMQVQGYMGGGFPIDSIQGQAAGVFIIVNKALNYMCQFLSRQPTRWAAVDTMQIRPRAGKAANAFYNRGSLQFFFFPHPNGGNLFTANSSDVVSHEFGHAFLDIIRPELWSQQATEIWAFHEAFGDIVAVLTAMQSDRIMENAIEQTNGEVWKTNIATRLAEEMGKALYVYARDKDGELDYALRDVTVPFNYTEPEKLPKKGKDNQLLGECHSFSRIFSGAWYEMMMLMYQKNRVEGMEPKPALVAARDTAARYIMNGAQHAPMTVRFFEAVCRQMMHLDRAEGGKYQKIMTDVFSSRNLLREKMSALCNVSLEEIRSMLSGFEEHTESGLTALRVTRKKEIKLCDHLGDVTALSENPLTALSVEVPDQSGYFFDAQGLLVDKIEANEQEIIDSAYSCLQYLHETGNVGRHKHALFSKKSGKLVRKQFACKCNRPNYCDPNAPEYGKPWKPKHNSGCVNCRSNCEPAPCDCSPPQPSPPRKRGCYTAVRVGSVRSIKVGSSTSRKVC